MSPLLEFSDRIAVLATMHQKEQAIAPILERELGLNIVVPENFNTDLYGTFTREKSRPGDQIDTARLKAIQALAITGETLAIASEGSFGPHPEIPFLSCNREVVLLFDQQNAIEVVGQTLSLETNYASQAIASYAEAQAFAAKVGFPSHGLIVMSDREPTSTSLIFKGLTTEAALDDAVAQALSQSSTGKGHLEPEMRALYNPTRMKAIAVATQNLVENLRHCCPRCGCPGFAIAETQPGLPCALCASPTHLTLAVHYVCQKCHFSQEIFFPKGQETADPGQCLYCNP